MWRLASWYVRQLLEALQSSGPHPYYTDQVEYVAIHQRCHETDVKQLCMAVSILFI